MSTSIATPSEIVIGSRRWQVRCDLGTILSMETSIGPGGLGDLALDLAPLGKVTPAHSKLGARYSIKAPKFEGALEANPLRPGTASLTLNRVAERGMITYSTIAGEMCALLTALITVKAEMGDMTLVVALANAAGQLGDAFGPKLGGGWGAPVRQEGKASAATVAPRPAPWQTLFRVPGVEPAATRGSS